MIRVNSRSARAFGYSQEELVGQAVEMLIPQRFRVDHSANRAEFTASPSTQPMGTGQALFGRRKDGSEFQVDVSLSPMQTQDGMLVLCATRTSPIASFPNRQ